MIIWVFLIAVAPDTYGIGGYFNSQEECEQKIEIEFDQCLPAKVEFLKGASSTTFYIIPPLK